MIPCRNNQRTMGRVLDSIRALASQLVIVDSGSTDATLDLINACRQWGTCEVLLIETQWRGFVKTKQLALDACTSDYTLWLDSDEPVSPKLAQSIKAAMAKGVDAATVNRVVEYKGKLLNHCWQPEHRLRLVKTSLVQSNKARFAGIDPHDYLELDPPHSAPLLEGPLIHESFESFAQHIDNARRLSLVSAKSMHDMGKRTSPLRLMTSPPGAFLKQLILKGAWRDGSAGWLCASTSAAAALMKHMMLYELQCDSSESLRDAPDIQKMKQYQPVSNVPDVIDERLGVLSFEPQMEMFEGRVKFGGQRIRIAVSGEGGELNPISRESAVRVLDRLELLVADAKAYGADEYLDFWNSNRPHDCKTEYTKDDFVRELSFWGFSVFPEGHVNFEFECNRVMPDHGLTVSASPDHQLEECVMGG
tara:strand:- start:3434 stop:4690 length:1257 start_codon:yes stop_codon:yes gene_type:complete